MVEAIVKLYARETLGIKDDIGWLYRRLTAVVRTSGGGGIELSVPNVWKALEDVCGSLFPFARLMFEGLRQRPLGKPEPIEAWRGVRLPLAVVERWRAAVGKLVVVPSFQSFIGSKARAGRFPPPDAPAAPGDVDVFFVLVTQALPVIDRLAGPCMQGEDEVVICPFSVLLVDGVSERPVEEGRYLISLREIDQTPGAKRGKAA